MNSRAAPSFNTPPATEPAYEPMQFTVYDAPDTPGLDTRFDESLMRHSAKTGPSASIWHAPQGLVVPRTYVRSAHFDATCERFAADGWPVSVRHSGGGVVPQGPGILNVSLSYTVHGQPLDHSDAAYQLLCDLMAQAAARFGIQAHTRAVEGSFCDGRFNLASGHGANARKIAGTAQLWRRQPGTDGSYVQTVLVHGLLLVSTDVTVATYQANALEQALGHSRRYLPTRAASMHELLSSPAPHSDGADFVQRVRSVLLELIRTPQKRTHPASYP